MSGKFCSVRPRTLKEAYFFSGFRTFGTVFLNRATEQSFCRPETLNSSFESLGSSFFEKIFFKIFATFLCCFPYVFGKAFLGFWQNRYGSEMVFFEKNVFLCSKQRRIRWVHNGHEYFFRFKSKV